MKRDTFRCLALSTLALLPLPLDADAAPMPTFFGSEGDELMPAVNQFLRPASSSVPSDNFAHMGLWHEYAGEHNAAQLSYGYAGEHNIVQPPYGNNAVSGHLPSAREYPGESYYPFPTSEDHALQYPVFGHAGLSSPVTPLQEYMPFPPGGVQGTAAPQGYQGWSVDSATPAVQGWQGITSAALQHPQDINDGVAGGSGSFPTHGYPPTAQIGYHPNPLQNVDWSFIHAPGQRGEPFPYASGFSSKMPVHAPRTTAGGSHLAVGPDVDPATSRLMEDHRHSSYVGPYPRSTPEAEEEFLLRKADFLFSDQHLASLTVKGQTHIIHLSDPDLDQWLVRVMDLRLDRFRQHKKDSPNLRFSILKDQSLGSHIQRDIDDDKPNRSGRAPFKNVENFLDNFDVGAFTFHLRVAPSTVEKNNRRFAAYKTKPSKQVPRMVYFGRLNFEKDGGRLTGEREGGGKRKAVKRGAGEHGSDLVSVPR